MQDNFFTSAFPTSLPESKPSPSPAPGAQGTVAVPSAAGTPAVPGVSGTPAVKPTYSPLSAITIMLALAAVSGILVMRRRN